uniref:Uncharacterized protein n=1 Tax=Triticum urartu TaxID=4572 RepID=A0A8R7Q3G6_TRIUA
MRPIRGIGEEEDEGMSSAPAPGFQEWTSLHIVQRTWMEIMEKTLVHPHTNIISFLQE